MEHGDTFQEKLSEHNSSSSVVDEESLIVNCIMKEGPVQGICKMGN